MTKRRAPTKKEVGIVLMRQEGKCANASCRAKLSWDNTEWDHIVPLGLGGENDAENFAALCKSCHSAKTRGTGATTAGSDIGKIAKVKRIAGKKASRFSGPPRGENIGSDDADHACVRNGRRYQWPKRKMQSRGFAKGARA